MNYLSNKSRVLVNIIGIPLILTIICLGNNSFANIPFFSIFIFIVMMLGMKEWNDLTRINNKIIRIMNFISIGFIFTGLHLNCSNEYFLLIILHILTIFDLFFCIVTHQERRETQKA